MAISLGTTAVLGGLMAAAIALAPNAVADDSDDLSRPGGARGSSQQDTAKEAGPGRGSAALNAAKQAPRPGPGRAPSQRGAATDVPKGWTNEALWAQPGPGGSNPFGTLPKPPIFALD